MTERDFSINLDDDDEDSYGYATEEDVPPVLDEQQPQMKHEAKRPRGIAFDGPQPKRNNKGSNNRGDAKKSLCSAPQAGKSRTIYLGGLPEGTTHFDVHHQIFSQIRGAPVESLRLIHAKQCGFIDFFDEAGAMAFAERWDRGPRRFMVREKEVKVAWAGSTNFSAAVQTAIKNGATRNVYVNNIEIDEDDGEALEAKRDELEEIFKRFGPIDMVRVVPDRKIAFIHMCSVQAAMEAVNVLSSRPEWKGHRFSFGSDRCGDRPPPGVHPSVQAKRRLNNYDDDDAGTGGGGGGGPTDSASRLPYRTIYIGGLVKGITLEDLCDVIRGGLIQSIRMAPEEKHCAFVTFVDEPSAITFYDHFSLHGFVVKGTSLKLGWSKPSAVPLSVTQALQTGATRNIYLGNIHLPSLGPDPAAHLLSDCSRLFGPVETINLIVGKNLAFVTFCNLLDAVKALAGLREMEEYAQCKVAYGKDRCAQLPRADFAPLPLTPSAAAYPYQSPYPQGPTGPSYVHPSYFSSQPQPQPYPTLTTIPPGYYPPHPNPSHPYPPHTHQHPPYPYYPNSGYPPVQYVPMVPVPYPYYGGHVPVGPYPSHPPPPTPGATQGPYEDNFNEDTTLT